jgi:hypothetical protein
MINLVHINSWFVLCVTQHLANLVIVAFSCNFVDATSWYFDGTAVHLMGIRWGPDLNLEHMLLNLFDLFFLLDLSLLHTV